MPTKTPFALAIGLSLLTLPAKPASGSGEIVGAVMGDRFPELAIDVDGEIRHFIVYRPESYCEGGPAILLLHGGTQSMRIVLEDGRATTRWLGVAEEQGALLLVPNGTNLDDGPNADEQVWNDIRDSQSPLFQAGRRVVPEHGS